MPPASRLPLSDGGIVECLRDQTEGGSSQRAKRVGADLEYLLGLFDAHDPHIVESPAAALPT